MSVTLALAQLQIEPADVETNLDRAADAVSLAADRGADLVVLPELFTVGFFAFDAYASSACGLSGPIPERLRSIATEHDVGLIAGSFVEDLTESAADGHDTPASEGYANTVPCFDRDGVLSAVYRKRHLFGYDSEETALLTPGERHTVFEFGGLSIGVTVCYDLRFPKAYRALVDRGATAVVVPSAWPYPRIEHWRTLARARAVENLWYVAAANGVGQMREGRLCGRSAVYDPWGTTVASLPDEPDLLVAELDPDRVAAIREEFPAIEDRRDE